MGPTWEQLTDWAIRPTAVTAAVAFVLFALALWPAERVWGKRQRSRPRPGGFLGLLEYLFVAIARRTRGARL